MDIIVNHVFLSKDKRINLRVLSQSGEGIEAEYYCILEAQEDSWNGYHSYNHLKTEYDYKGNHKGKDIFSTND